MAENITLTNTTLDVDPFYVKTYQWTKNSASIFVSLSFMLGVPGNSLVILVHTKIKEKTVTDWLIFYIAVCDILSLINAPLYVCQYQSIWTYGFPNFLCKYHYFNLNSVSIASYFCCATTAVERYCKVINSKDLFSIRQAKLIWIPIFFISFGLGSLTIWTVNNNINGHCMFDNDGRYLATIEYGILLLVAFLSSAIMSFCYIRIGVYLFMKMKEITKSEVGNTFSKSYKNTIQTTRMLAIVTCVFLVSANAPYIIGVVFTINQPTSEPAMTIMIAFGIAFFINNFFNPFLYMAMSQSFRKRTLDIFKKCCNSKYAVSEETSENTPGVNSSDTTETNIK